MTAISKPYILMWTIVGVFLTIGANFIPVYFISPPWQWFQSGITVDPAGIKCQVGAVLLVSCLGGRTTGVLTQILYLLLGLLWFKIFNDGGGLEYLQKPTFGYLLAFVPGAWVCGQLAFKRTPQLEHLAISSLVGLLTIHVFGIIYLICFNLINWQRIGGLKLGEMVMNYSIYPFPSQMMLICAIASISYLLRRIMFY